MSLQDELKASRTVPPGAGDPTAGRPRRRPPRLDLAVACLVLAAPALALLAWGAARQRVGDLEERLVSEATEIYGASHPRPVHVDAPAPGSVGDAAVRHLPAIDAEAATTVGKQVEVLQAVVAGEAPVAALPARWAAALGRLGPDLDGLLAGARAERADFPGTVGALEGPGASWKGMLLAASLSGARIRLALAAGEGEPAFAECLDALGLARDASISGGLLGRIVGVSMVRRLVPPCASALDALPDARLPDAGRRLRAVRDALPPLSATMREDGVALQLVTARSLGEGILARVPGRARAVADEVGHVPAWWEKLLYRDGWRTMRAALDRTAAASDLPEPDREEAFEEVERSLERRLNFLAGVVVPVRSRLKFARRMENVRRRLDALVLLAAARSFRAERGAWPRGVPDLHGAGLLDAAEAARAEAELERRGDGLALHASLLRPAPDDPARLTLLASAPPRAAAPPGPARARAAARR